MFVAAWPDDPTLQRLSLLELEPAPGLRLVRPAQFHITLRFLGEVDEDVVPALVDALDIAADETPGPVHCEVGPATAWFSGHRVLQIPAAGLDALAAAVHAATLAVLPEADRNEPPFAGHLTVARSNRRRLHPPARAALAGLPLAASFDVDCFDLVASELSNEGPRYTTLRRVPLRG
jgi:2'-5' RNA ligase